MSNFNKICSIYPQFYNIVDKFTHTLKNYYISMILLNIECNKKGKYIKFQWNFVY